jgi:hypothetical protein
MSAKSASARGTGTKSNAAILDKLINETSPRSFSSNELEEIMSLSDTSIDTNGKLVKRKMPVWPISASDSNKNRTDDDDDGDDDAVHATQVTKPRNEEDEAKAAVEAAAAAADALGKDLEAMGYDLECRSFIKKRGADSFTALSPENENVERYTSTNTIAPFSEEEVNDNKNDVIKLLRSTSDLIEATRSSSDLIVALRSMSSEDQQDAVNPILSIGSNGTGPMMVQASKEESDGKPQENEGRSVTSNRQRDTDSVVSRKSYHIIQSQPSNKSRKSLKSYHSQRSMGNNTRASSSSAVSSIKTHRSQKTSSSRRTASIHIDRLPTKELNQKRSGGSVLVETVTSIPSTLSQYHIQYTTTSSADDKEPLKLMASPSQQNIMMSRQSSTVIHEDKIGCNEEVIMEEQAPTEVAVPERIGNATNDRKKKQGKSASNNFETRSCKLPSQRSLRVQESRDESSPQRLPKILQTTSEGGKPNTSGANFGKFSRSLQRHERIKKDDTVKSKSSYWSAKAASKKSWKSRNASKSRSPSDHDFDNDDEASEVSSIASSHAAPPFPILSIPMKQTKQNSVKVDENNSDSSKRPPRIPKASSSQRSSTIPKASSSQRSSSVPKASSSQRSSSVPKASSSQRSSNVPKASSSQRSTPVSVKSMKIKPEVVPESVYIETKRSVDSRTVEEMSPEGMEMTAIVVNPESRVNDSCRSSTAATKDVELATAPSMESKSSSKKLLKAMSRGSKATLLKENSLQVETPLQTAVSETDVTSSEKTESPQKNDTFGITSNLSTGEVDAQKAKEQEQIARQLILANMVERQRRIRRSIHARDTLLKLVHQKTGDEKLETMTLPPTFEVTNPSMRSSAKSAPTHMVYSAPPIVPATTTSATTMPKQLLPSTVINIASPTSSEMCDSIESDSTPKVRGGARIFNFLSFSPEKRPRAAKANKSQYPPLSKVKLIQIPSFGRRLKNVQSERGKQKKGTKKKHNHRSLFHLKKTEARANFFSAKMMEDNRPLEDASQEMSQEISQSMYDVPSIKKNPKVTYVDLDDSFEAIEVSYSKSPSSTVLPPMLGADKILEKIMEEGSCDDVKSYPSNPEDAPTYDVQPLVISPVRASANDSNDDMLALTRKAALEDLKKVGASMIANKADIAPIHTKGNVVKETVDSPPKQSTFSFFSAVDKWFFEPLSKSSVSKKTETTAQADKSLGLNDKVFAGLALSVTSNLQPSNLESGPMRTPVATENQNVSSPMSKDREKTLEYLDQELKSREENSLKSISELEEKIKDGTFDYNRTIPTHLILNNVNDDDGSCLTALNSTLTRTVPHMNQNGFSNGKDDVSALSDVMTMDQWNEIAEAALTVERALKNIEQSGGLKSNKSDANNSKPSFTFINDEVEHALHVLSKHAARLGVSESDILMALGGSSYDDETDAETLDPSILAQQLSRSPGPRARPTRTNNPRTDDDDMETAVTMDDGTTNSLTMGEEILEVLQMYMTKK